MHVYGNFNVGILNCSICRGPSLRNVIRCIRLSRLLHHSSLVSLRYPLFSDGHRVVGTSTVSGVGSNIIFVGATHNNLISAGTLVRNVHSNGVNTTNLSICRRRNSGIFHGHSGAVVRSIASALYSFPGIIVADRRTFFAGRTLTSVTGAALSGTATFTGNRRLANPTIIY